MNVKTRRLARRISEDAIEIHVNGPVDMKSDEVIKIISELNKGHAVWVSAQSSPRRKSTKAHISTQAEKSDTVSMSFSDVATALSGGAAIGLTALALAPASAFVAGVAAIVGVCVSGALTKVIDRSH